MSVYNDLSGPSTATNENTGTASQTSQIGENLEIPRLKFPSDPEPVKRNQSDITDKRMRRSNSVKSLATTLSARTPKPSPLDLSSLSVSPPDIPNILHAPRRHHKTHTSQRRKSIIKKIPSLPLKGKRKESNPEQVSSRNSSRKEREDSSSSLTDTMTKGSPKKSSPTGKHRAGIIKKSEDTIDENAYEKQFNELLPEEAKAFNETIFKAIKNAYLISCGEQCSTPESGYLKTQDINCVAINRANPLIMNLYLEISRLNTPVSCDDLSKLVQLVASTTIKKEISEGIKNLCEPWLVYVSYLRTVISNIFTEYQNCTKIKTGPQKRTYFTLTLLKTVIKIQKLLKKHKYLDAVETVENISDPRIKSLMYLTIDLEDRKDVSLKETRAFSVLECLKYWFSDECLEDLKDKLRTSLKQALLESRVKKMTIQNDVTPEVEKRIEETKKGGGKGGDIYQIRRSLFPEDNNTMLPSSITLNGEELFSRNKDDFNNYTAFFTELLTKLAPCFFPDSEIQKQTELLLKDEPYEALEVLILGANGSWAIPDLELRSRFAKASSNKFSLSQNHKGPTNIHFTGKSIDAYSVTVEKQYTVSNKEFSSSDGIHFEKGDLATFMVRWKVERKGGKWLSTISFPKTTKNSATSGKKFQKVLDALSEMQYPDEITFSNPELYHITKGFTTARSPKD